MEKQRCQPRANSTAPMDQTPATKALADSPNTCKRPRSESLGGVGATARADDLKANGDGGESDEGTCAPRAKRLLPHVLGNWATTVFLPVNISEDAVAEAEEVLEDARPLAKGERISKPHVSLSRTFALREHQIEGFVRAIQEKLEPYRKFEISARYLRLFRSENQSRIFAALLTDRGSDRIKNMIQAVDEVVESFQGPPYYANPIPHISLVAAVETSSKIIRESKCSDAEEGKSGVISEMTENKQITDTHGLQANQESSIGGNEDDLACTKERLPGPPFVTFVRNVEVLSGDKYYSFMLKE